MALSTFGLIIKELNLKWVALTSKWKHWHEIRDMFPLAALLHLFLDCHVLGPGLT